MKGHLLVSLVVVLSAVALYNYQPESNSLEMEAPVIDYFNLNAECTKTLELECAVDIERTVVACSKAF